VRVHRRKCRGGRVWSAATTLYPPACWDLLRSDPGTARIDVWRAAYSSLSYVSQQLDGGSWPVLNSGKHKDRFVGMENRDCGARCLPLLAHLRHRWSNPGNGGHGVPVTRLLSPCPTYVPRRQHPDAKSSRVASLCAVIRISLDCPEPGTGNPSNRRLFENVARPSRLRKDHCCRAALCPSYVSVHRQRKSFFEAQLISDCFGNNCIRRRRSPLILRELF
jgi:hypothetical protein